MNVIGIDRNQQMDLWRLIMSILYLGNISFQSNGKEGSNIVDTQGSIS